MTRFQQAQMPKQLQALLCLRCWKQGPKTRRSEPYTSSLPTACPCNFKPKCPKPLLAASGPVAVAPLLETKGAPTGFRNCWMALFQQARMPKTRASKLPLLEAKHQNAAAHCFYWVFETAGWHVCSRLECLKPLLAASGLQSPLLYSTQTLLEL